MEIEYKLIFHKSKSLNYKKVISLCKKFIDFKEDTDNDINTIIITNNELSEKILHFKKIFYLIKNWKKITFYKNDKKIDLSSFLFYFETISQCQDKRIDLDFSDNNTYCDDIFNRKGWGCNKLTDILKHIDYSSKYRTTEYWYRFGRYIDDKWEIDKNEIIFSLKKEIERKNIDTCIFFNIETMLEEVKSLPDYIEVNDNWELEYFEDFDKDKIVSKVSNIKHKSKHQNKTSFGFSLDLNEILKDSNQEKIETSPDKTPNNKTMFKDIGGLDDEILKIKETLETSIKNPAIYEYLGIKPIKGILLHGEPGNGKTLLAKAMSNEFNMNFISIKASELLSKYHGESEINLINIFEKAKVNKPSIIYFDEFDSIGVKRSNNENSTIHNKFVNQLLSLIDGIYDSESVYIIASTNRIDMLDEALLRPGRFDLKIEIKKPNLKGINQIIEIYKNKMPIEDFDTSFVSDYLIGYSASEIEFIFKEAALMSLKRNYKLENIIENNIQTNKIKITIDDIFESINKYPTT